MNAFNNGAAPFSPVRLGMPVSLFWGYVAMAIFMTGDGIELAYLSTHLFSTGLSEKQVSLVFTLYALTAALSSWLSGGISEIFGPRKIMLTGAAWWILVHAVFVFFGIRANDYTVILASYCLRGFAYPLFFYGFYVLVVQRTPGHRLASATGWIWSMFTIGYGICASFLAGFAVPRIGFESTLWLSSVFAAVGGAMAVFLIKEAPPPARLVASRWSEKLQEIARGLTLMIEDRSLFLALIARVLCNVSLFGLPVFMPIYFVKQLGYSTEEWSHIWGVFFLVQPLTNVLWGICGDRVGWLPQMRWVGFFGSALSTLAFYHLPSAFPGNVWIAMGCALLLALTLTSFVPMGAIFPMLAPEHKGAAVSLQNLGGGLGNLIGPAVATLMFSLSLGIGAVILAFSVLYVLGGMLTLFIRNPQPSVTATP
ncbi:MFS transporter [Herbaspirillum robiniae]|uniref:Cytochrome C biogenesis protein CcdA n=1 Tax=Herbaspirillum robiniae TaxID=2014887 RepID=A0A246WUW4_9BURK|nr:MFS transporter [Herbaspirillum robiniae]OWY30880.1 cytochrome C biogenesis protein CcdA [Herbaspirillum robiniae]